MLYGSRTTTRFFYSSRFLLKRDFCFTSVFFPPASLACILDAPYGARFPQQSITKKGRTFIPAPYARWSLVVLRYKWISRAAQEWAYKKRTDCVYIAAIAGLPIAQPEQCAQCRCPIDDNLSDAAPGTSLTGVTKLCASMIRRDRLLLVWCCVCMQAGVSQLASMYSTSCGLCLDRARTLRLLSQSTDDSPRVREERTRILKMMNFM